MLAAGIAAERQQNAAPKKGEPFSRYGNCQFPVCSKELRFFESAYVLTNRIGFTNYFRLRRGRVAAFPDWCARAVANGSVAHQAAHHAHGAFLCARARPRANTC